MDFAGHLRRMLAERRLSLREFARRTDRSVGFIHNVLHGKNGPPDDITSWVIVLGLQGDERDEFLLTGALARSPELVRRYVADLEGRLAKMAPRKRR